MSGDQPRHGCKRLRATPAEGLEQKRLRLILGMMAKEYKAAVGRLRHQRQGRIPRLSRPGFNAFALWRFAGDPVNQKADWLSAPGPVANLTPKPGLPGVGFHLQPMVHMQCVNRPAVAPRNTAGKVQQRRGVGATAERDSEAGWCGGSVLGHTIAADVITQPRAQPPYRSLVSLNRP